MITYNPETDHYIITAANVGHGVRQTQGIPVADLHARVLEHVRNAELSRRGLRFLPAQAVKRALRTRLHSLNKENPPAHCFVSNHTKLFVDS